MRPAISSDGENEGGRRCRIPCGNGTCHERRDEIVCESTCEGLNTDGFNRLKQNKQDKHSSGTANASGKY